MKSRRKQMNRFLAILMILAILFADMTMALSSNRVYAEVTDGTQNDEGLREKIELSAEETAQEEDEPPVSESSIVENGLNEQDLSNSDETSEGNELEQPEQEQKDTEMNQSNGINTSEKAAEDESQPYIEQENTVKTTIENQEETIPDTTVEESAENAEQADIDFNSLPEVLITEIMPNNSGADQFEYFEVYNNSNQPIILDHYQLALRYTDGSGNDDVEMTFSPVTLDANETIVFWLNGSNRTLADFNAHYQTNLTEEDIVEYSGAPGFYNSGNRAVVIKDSKGEDIVWANYLPGDFTDGKVIEYQAPSVGIEMETYQKLAEPTPGQIAIEQLPAKSVTLPENVAPTLEHTPVVEVGVGQDVTIEANITDDYDDITAIVFYQTGENNQKLKMSKTESGTYRAVIPNAQLQSDIFTYYIVVTDSNNRVNLGSAETPFEVSVLLEEENFDAYPHLLITEISPNSSGGGTDYYEFIELYNNTNQPLTLTNYSFVYRYTDTGQDLPFQVPAVTMDPQETIILWFNNGNRPLADFNANFGTNLTHEQVFEFTSVFPGFANGGNRAIVIQDLDGNEVISASYLGEDNDNTGVDIHYKYPKLGTEMIKERTAAAPTPGIIDTVQVPKETVTLPDVIEDEETPVIEHTPITEASAFSPLTIEATVTDNQAVPLVTLYFKEEGADNFTSLSMHPNVENPSVYSAEILGMSVQADMVYYIEATDGTNLERTEEYTIVVEQIDVDYQAVPQFLVTEVVPDTANIDGADGYEFIEIYNNSDQAIDFKDYKLNYRYDRDPSRDVVWPSVPEGVVIPAGEALVFWITNAKNGSQTVADFNAHYETNLVENEDIVRIYSGGMANSGMRGLVVKSNVGKEIAVSYYNDQPNMDDTVPDKGIIYTYPVDKSMESMKVSAGLEDATPGSLEEYQVPEQPVQVEIDEIAPIIENKTTVFEVHEKDNIQISTDVQDNKEVVSVRLFYKTTKQADYQQVVLKADANDGLYHYTIYSPELIGNENLEYYFVATDGFTEVTSDTFEATILNDRDDSSLRLNVDDEEIVSGDVILKGTSQSDLAQDVKMYIDGQEQMADTYHSLENVAYFAIEVNGLNTYFKNAVTMGEDVLYLMDQDWLTDWKTFSIPIDPNLLQVGENTITVRSGNKASPFDLESTENRDNYDLRNVRLVLADGTILRDANFTDPTRSIGMNDENPFEHFNFTITDEHAKAKTYVWDTTTVQDGAHTVMTKDSDEELTRTVLVDNTAPTVETTIVEGKEYKGAFIIDVEATDVLAGVDSVQVLLDDQSITVPYETASSKLSSGEHKLTVIATDSVGNKNERIVHFSVVNENPEKPELESPNGDGTVVGNPKLKVTVTDPTGDHVDVAFYQGYHYDPTMTESVKGFKNASDTEPPQTMVPGGEQAFTAEDIAKAGEMDGDYLITDSDTQFPYHRFDITVDEAVDENDIVELIWQGNSLEGRKVTMYAWSHMEDDWVLIDYKIAGNEDFELKGNVAVNEFVNDSKVNVLVQDEIPSSPDDYDYTFVWMSDTQYYAESYPHIFDRQTQWIAEMKEEMKIKYVFHTGDLVDEADKEYQWHHADQFMGVLDENDIPYGVLAGNHDVNGVNNDYTEYYKYFGAERFLDKPYYGGSYLNNRGHYDLISAGGNDFIMVYLGWDVTDEGIAWMNEVLAAHPDRKAILNFHEYLLATGTRHPLGEKLYNEIVVPNENVFAVLSGHYHEAQTFIDEIDDNGDGISDRTVYQMLADYQAGPEGGQGYMRLLHFDQDNNRIIVNTYSPYMNDYNYYDTDQYPGKDEFIIELDLTVQEKRVATDYFAVNVYTDTEIGTVSDVRSGETAEVTWTGLEEGQTYSWYTVVRDQFTGETRSDLWTFVKGENEGTVNPPDEGDGEEPSDGAEENPEDDSGNRPGDESNNPEVPSNPGDREEEDDASVSNDETPKAENGSENGNNKGEENSKAGAELPDTATSMFNLIVLGAALLVLGSCLYIYYRRKAMGTGSTA